MLGFKSFHVAQATITGVENVRMIQKGQITEQTVNQFLQQFCKIDGGVAFLEFCIF
jgi:transposase-like protein